MRMCYLSISHTNVFSVTVPPGRLQEGSGALIKAAFARQECGLLCLGVTEGLGVRPTEPLLTWPAGRDWAHGQLCLAVIRCFSLSLAFPLSPSTTLPLARTHSHVTTKHTHAHPLLSFPLYCLCPSLSSFPTSMPWLLLGFPAASPRSALLKAAFRKPH